MAECFAKGTVPQRGQRVEIPVHYDLWMQGARFGEVRSFHKSKTPGVSDYVAVKLDHPRARRQLKVWRHDWPYMKNLSAKG